VVPSVPSVLAKGSKKGTGINSNRSGRGENSGNQPQNKLLHLDNQIGRAYACSDKATDCAGREAISDKREGRFPVVDSYHAGNAAVTQVISTMR
jgi:hypothetical protein